MTPELIPLALNALLHAILVFWSQAHLTRDVGTEGNMGPRDSLPDFSVMTGRLRRALANHVENWPLFLTGIAIVAITGNSSAMTVALAWIYVIARALYIPAYAFGWTPWRSLFFMAGFLSCALLIVVPLI